MKITQMWEKIDKEKLIKRYQTLTQKLAEMETTQNTQQNSQQINDLNQQIYKLQNTLLKIMTNLSKD